jgi:hypothetical protein
MMAIGIKIPAEPNQVEGDLNGTLRCIGIYGGCALLVSRPGAGPRGTIDL